MRQSRFTTGKLVSNSLLLALSLHLSPLLLPDSFHQLGICISNIRREADSEAASAPESLHACSTCLAAKPSRHNTKARSKAPMPETVVSQPVKMLIEPEILLADDLMRKGEFNDAEDLYFQVVRHNPESLPALLGYGMALAKQFKLQAASRQFDRVIELDQHNALARAGKALVLYNSLSSSDKNIRARKKSIIEEAIGTCEEATKLDPQMPEAWFILGNLKRSKGELDKALECYLKAVEIDSQFAEALAGVGLIYNEQDKYADAELNFKKAIEISPLNPTAHYGLGVSYAGQDKLDLALSELEKSRELLRENFPLRLALADVYKRKGEIGKARLELEQASKIRKDIESPYKRLAELEEDQAELDAALDALERGLAVLPKSALLNRKKGDLLLKSVEFEKSIDQYSKALSLKPADEDSAIGLARAIVLKAIKEESNDSDDRFIDILEQAVKSNPRSPSIRMARSYIALLLGRTESLEPLSPEASKYMLPSDIDNSDATTKKSDKKSSVKTKSQVKKIQPVQKDSKNSKNRNQEKDADKNEPSDEEVEIHPDVLKELTVYSDALFSKKDLSGARSLLKRVVDAKSKQLDENCSREILDLADIAILQKDLDTARNALQAARKPSAPYLNKRLAILDKQITEENDAASRLIEEAARDFEARDYSGSAEKYRKSLTHDPRRAEARLALAQALEKIKKPETRDIEDTLESYKLYINLAAGSSLEAKELSRLDKKIKALQSKLAKLNSPSKKSKKSH